MASNKPGYTVLVKYLMIVLLGNYGLVNPSDYKLMSSYKKHDQAVKECSTLKRGHLYRLARISTKTDLQEAQKTIKKEQDGFWTALSYKQDRGGGWMWDGKVRISNPSRDILSHQQESALRGSVCFYIDKQNSTLISADCDEPRRFLCEKVKTKTTDVTPSRSFAVSTTRPFKATDKNSPEEKAKNIMSQYLRNLEQAKVNQRDSMQYVVNETSDLFTNLQAQNVGADTVNVMFATQQVEKFAINYAKTHLQNSTNPTNMAKKQLVLSLGSVKPNRKEAVTFPSTGLANSLGLKEETFIELPAKLFTTEKVVVNILYKDMKDLVSSQLHENIKKHDNTVTTKLNSAIISSTLDPAPDHVLKENVVISLKHLKEPTANEEALCVFWDFEANPEFNGTWSTRGCRVVQTSINKTVCSCNHLTNFAVLMQTGKVKIPQEHQFVLSIITYIGCAFSLAGEIFTIITYTMFMNLKTEQSQIRVNLVVSIAVAQIVFISGINSTSNVIGCIFVAVFIHYFYLVAFCWMLMEGIYLYLMIVKVFNTAIKMKPYYVFAWGFPLLIVTISFIIAATMERGVYSYLPKYNQLCWVSFENNMVWTFVGPVLLICFLNAIILVRVVHEIAKLHSSKGQEVSSVKQSLKACAILFPLLGFTWVFGVMSVTKAALVFQYIFTIINSFQASMSQNLLRNLSQPLHRGLLHYSGHCPPPPSVFHLKIKETLHTG